MFRAICEAIHREMDQLEEKYNTGAQLSAKDLEDIDKMAHALKSLKAYEAMEGSSEYGDSYEGSYARGRSRMTGRYVSREGDRGNGIPYEGSYRRY